MLTFVVEFILSAALISGVWLVLPLQWQQVIMNYLDLGYNYFLEHPRFALELVFAYLSWQCFWAGFRSMFSGVLRPVVEKAKAVIFTITRRHVETTTRDVVVTPVRRSIWDAVTGVLFWAMAFVLFPWKAVLREIIGW